MVAESESITRKAVFWLTISLLVLIPLAFDTNLHRTYVVPKLALLLVGASGLMTLIACGGTGTHCPLSLSARLFKSRHVIITALYMLTTLTATIFSVDPTASLFGHFFNQMGLITRFSFFVCFIGLISGIGLDHLRLETGLWSMIFAGLLVSSYAVAQFFGFDPFLPSVLYTSDSPEGTVVRVVSTLGHADYLGNFLLYTTPLSASLAIVSRGRARVLALLSAALSIIAIVVSGTRGAWLGLILGTVVFAILCLRKGVRHVPHLRRPQLVRAAAFALILIVTLVLTVSLSPASRSIVARARLSFTEGFTGAGRTHLWRDSIKMVPAFALTGSGPDNFRKAFLAYKSKELGRIAPINSESSPNSYLDAAISFGVPGFLLYVAIIVSTLTLLVRARRRTTNHRIAILIIGVISSFAAVTVHNFFIFDQIPTGLYFFAFVALAQVVANIVDSQDKAATEASNQKPRTTVNVPITRKVNVAVGAPALTSPKQDYRTRERQPFARTAVWAGRATVATGCVLLTLAVWYSVSLAQADAAIDKAMMSADKGDLNQVISIGERAADSPELTGEYNFLFARALVLCADRMDLNSRPKPAEVGGMTAWDQAIELAAARGQKSLAHTLTPDLNYLFLAYLAFATGDVVKLGSYAEEAASWDPNHFRTRWMLAEAYLARGDRYRAAQEAEFALEFDPTSREAKSVLARARGEIASPEAEVEEIIAGARKKAETGKLFRARRMLDRALKLSNGRCPECHRALALIYEAGNQYQNAIAEWQKFIGEAPDRVSKEKITSRIETLKQK